MTKVYIKLKDDYIVEINSSTFLVDYTGYIELDEGMGDKFTHASNNYLEKPLRDEKGRYNYKYIDNSVVEIAEEDKPIIETDVTDTEVLNAMLGV